ncbi:DUF2254 domain-containing protein [Pseudomonas mosselii]|uniref:DUF2254 domain-containing protein n=1 Tax=Pseudomonas mosselii TaxID=78327 RepID=UPI00244CC5F0|nr:DUF2254 domain-containing protein [Pseudomonas mosselii]MDH1528651.1 DUF2254 domain-containing protein [Pseudomonas mosselii]
MMARWRWVAVRVTKRLWFRATLFSLLGVATALMAVVLKDFIPASLPARIGAEAVDKILGIIASSMLAVTTFSLSTMVAAYGAASTGVTPRATTLVMEDTTTHNALATFIGSFLFSLVGLIALSTGAYGDQGRVLLFAVTIAVVILIVYTLLRWIDHLSRLGRVGETIDRVEGAAIEAIEHRAKWPYLGGAAYPQGMVFPPSALRLLSHRTGYVQHIDMEALAAITQRHHVQIYMDVLPGAFVYPGALLATIVAQPGQDVGFAGGFEHEVHEAITVGTRRTFEHDPRFGLSVLSEIASRALSPAVNDPGTAIDVIGRGVRCLSHWGRPQALAPSQGACAHVYLHGIVVDDLFDDFFGPIARDGAALQEVNIRLLKALLSLAQINPRLFEGNASRHARRLLGFANAALVLEDEKFQLRSLAAQLSEAR